MNVDAVNSKDLRLDGRVAREKRSLFQQVCFDHVILAYVCTSVIKVIYFCKGGNGRVCPSRSWFEKAS